MRSLKRTVHVWMLVVVVAFSGQFALAQNAGQEHWIATWASAQLQGRAPGAGARGAPGPAAAGAQAAPSTGFNNQTVRMIVRTTIGGKRVRVQFSNAYGTTALMIGSAHVAVRGQDSAIAAGSDRLLRFNGKRSVMVPPGAAIFSDPADLAVTKLSDLAVSVFVPEETGPLTSHATGLHTTYIAPGDLTAQTSCRQMPRPPHPGTGWPVSRWMPSQAPLRLSHSETPSQTARLQLSMRTRAGPASWPSASPPTAQRRISPSSMKAFPAIAYFVTAPAAMHWRVSIAMSWACPASNG